MPAKKKSSVLLSLEIVPVESPGGLTTPLLQDVHHLQEQTAKYIFGLIKEKGLDETITLCFCERNYLAIYLLLEGVERAERGKRYKILLDDMKGESELTGHLIAFFRGLGKPLALNFLKSLVTHSYTSRESRIIWEGDYGLTNTLLLDKDGEIIIVENYLGDHRIDDDSDVMYIFSGKTKIIQIKPGAHELILPLEKELIRPFPKLSINDSCKDEDQVLKQEDALMRIENIGGGEEYPDEDDW